jgi:tetratricopeptide (TPR) repeat protein
MNTRIWGIIGGVALVLALLSPLVLGSAQKVERLFEIAEALYERSDYKGAIEKYKAALKESKKLGTKTERIDQDFTTLANLKIARCYYELGESSKDDRHYQSALTHIKKVVFDAEVAIHQEELTYLWAEILYKTGDLNRAESKFSGLIKKFSNSRWVPKALYAIGEINYQQQNYDTAQETFQKLIAEFPYSELKTKAEQRIVELKYLVDNGPGPPEPPIPNPEPIGKRMYNSASDLKQQGSVHAAYQLYTDLITQYPDSKYVRDAYVAKAEIHLEAEDYVNARLNYEEAIYNTDDQEQKIELYKKYQRTYLIPVYADQAKQYSSSDELFVKSRLLRKEEQWLEAAKIYEQLANRNRSTEDTVYALYWAGRCYHKAALMDPNLFNKSVNTFKRLIKNYSSREYTFAAYYHLTSAYADWAKTFGNRSRCQSVIDTVEEANNTEYANSDDARDRGWLSRMQELKEIAIQKLNPSPPPEPVPDPDPIPVPEPVPDPGPLVDQGYRHLGKGELEEGTEKAEEALEIDVDYQRACELLSAIKETYYSRGWTFFDDEQYEKAIAAFKNAINIDSDFKEAHCHLGVIYIEQERYTKAVKALEKAVEIDPRFKEAHFNLALACLKLGEFECARNAANETLRIDPDYESAHMLLEFIAD